MIVLVFFQCLVISFVCNYVSLMYHKWRSKLTLEVFYVQLCSFVIFEKKKVSTDEAIQLASFWFDQWTKKNSMQWVTVVEKSLKINYQIRRLCWWMWNLLIYIDLNGGVVAMLQEELMFNVHQADMMLQLSLFLGKYCKRIEFMVLMLYAVMERLNNFTWWRMDTLVLKFYMILIYITFYY